MIYTVIEFVLICMSTYDIKNNVVLHPADLLRAILDLRFHGNII